MAPQSTSTQVIIIGAGLSGLRAATYLHNAGISYIVLEAMDRVGGKTLSIPTQEDGKAPVDVGAAWINDTSQSEMYTMAQKFGFDLVKQRDEGDSLFQDGEGRVVTYPFGTGAPIPPEQREQMRKIIFTLNGYVERSNLEHAHLGADATKLDSMTAIQFAQQEFNNSPLAISLITGIITALLGVEPSEVSALYFIDYIKSATGLRNAISDKKDGGQYLRNAQGNQSFSVKMAEGLREGSVRTSTPVRKICQTDGRCVVETEGGERVDAERVVITLPTPLYAGITFEPPLPPGKRSLAKKTKLGYYSKTIFVFESAWWREAGLSGNVSSESGPIAFTRDTSVPQSGQYSITCFHVGQRGRDWSKLSDTGRRDAAWKHFCELFGTVVDDIPQPIKVIEKEWTKEPWAQGAPSPVMPIGVMTSEAGQVLRESVGRIHFAGTETSVVWKGYMEGAVRPERGLRRRLLMRWLESYAEFPLNFGGRIG